MTALLRLEDVEFAYPGASRPVLRGASFHLDPGGRLGITGPNGGGKSTLFHIVTGLLTPLRGAVFFEETRLRSEEDFRKMRPAVGYLLQRTEDQLFCPTVLEDAAFGPLNLGLSPGDAKKRAEEALERLGIAHLARRAGCNLSGGERKLAALASVLSMGPRLLLLDEPTNDLDPESVAKLYAALVGLELPFVAVSHDERFLRDMCRVRLHLEDGVLLPCDNSFGRLP